ncbi:MAG: hypothetical protein AMXMBFR58_30820 [Phycisphaerae bacterium]
MKGSPQNAPDQHEHELRYFILDSLAVPAAVLTATGSIERVNAAWAQSSGAAALLGNVGGNVLASCEQLNVSLQLRSDLAAVLAGDRPAATADISSGHAAFHAVATGFKPRGGLLVVTAARSDAGRSGRPRGVAFEHEHLATIVDSAMDAIITVDETQHVVMFNASAERIFGVPVEMAVGSHLDRFIPERFRVAHRHHVQSFGQTGVTTRAMGRLGTLYGLRSDGKEFPIEASISQATAGGRRLYTVILRDVSERRMLEEQLIHSQKMEGIGRLAGGVAHDFNNLLTVMFGYLGVASSFLDPDHKAQAALTHTREAADRAAKLTRQLLAFARKQIVTPRVFSLRDAVMSLVPMLRRLIGEDVTLDVQCAEDTGYVKADVGQLEQVIMNLAVNARDAMPTGGTLTIRTANITLDDSYCRTHVGATPGPHVVITVADTGVGMPPEVLQRLFEPFFTTKRPGQGTGLGLATCHGVVRQLNGHINVQSQVGVGTSVHVLLPREPEGSVGQLELKPATPATGGSETILLVEDNLMVRELVSGALTNVGYRVISADGGSRAVHAAADTPGQIDLLVTDVIMPEMSGVRLAETISRARPAIKVLYMSGYNEETVLHHGVETETMAFLPKPFTVDALLTKIRSVLGSPARTTTR